MTSYNPVCNFHYHQKEKNEEQSFSKSQKEWNKCTDKEMKSKCIFEAIENGMKSPYYKGNPQFILNKIKKEDLTLYVRHKKLITPPIRPYLLYVYIRKPENPPPEADIIDFNKWARQKFDKLTVTKQIFWFRKFILIWDRFDKILSKQTPFDLAAFKKVYKNIDKGERVTLPQRRGRKPMGKEFEVRQVVVFEDEPKPPTLKPEDYFAFIMKCGSNDSVNAEPSQSYDALRPIVKASIIEKVLDFRKEYADELVNYVDKMPDDRKELYLLQRRDVIFDLLDMDPFKQKYPRQKIPNKKPTPPEENSEDEDYLIEEEDCNWTKVDVLAAIRNSILQLDKLGYELK